MARIPNYKINTEISAFNEFENYNRTIVASRSGNLYSIEHWATKVLEYDLTRNEITYLLDRHYSQTTSTLVGRIVRSLPNPAVVAFIETLGDKTKQRRLLRMLRVAYR